MSDFANKKSPHSFVWTTEYITITAGLKYMVTTKRSKKEQSTQRKELHILCELCVSRVVGIVIFVVKGFLFIEDFSEEHFHIIP
jgi:hypothetical protein